MNEDKLPLQGQSVTGDYYRKCAKQRTSVGGWIGFAGFLLWLFGSHNPFG